MAKEIIGVDVDGILANFNKGFAQLLKTITGKKLVNPDKYEPDTWDWPTKVGYNKFEQDAAWRYIETDNLFWRSLFLLPDARDFLAGLEALGAADLYFITARPGLSAKAQTEDWLRIYLGRFPTVIITSDKGGVCRAVKATRYIDDRWENCLDVRNTTDAKVYMLDRGYNQDKSCPGIQRVYSTVDMLIDITSPQPEVVANVAH